MPKIKRSQFQAFLDTTPSSTATYSLIGDGVTTGTINYNPEVVTEAYIHQDSSTTTLERYAPTFPIEAQCVQGDDVFDFIDGLRQSRAVGSDAETDLLLVYLYETPANTDQYPAELQPVTIQIDSFGGDGATTNRINYTISFRGDPTAGAYDVSDGTFTPS